MRDVAGELPGPEDCDERVAGGISDLDLARLDDEELEVTIADLEERLAGPVLLERRPGAPAQLRHLRLVERGEGGSLQVVLGHVETPSNERSAERAGIGLVPAGVLRRDSRASASVDCDEGALPG